MKSGPKPLPIAERLFKYLLIDDKEKCWQWRGAKMVNGYGFFYVGNGRKPCSITAHRAAYEVIVGPVPEGLVVDHKVCDNRICCNPSHLEPTTQRVNILRGTSLSARRARQTHCSRGHEFTDENTIHETGRIHRRCKICLEARERGRGSRRSHHGRK